MSFLLPTTPHYHYFKIFIVGSQPHSNNALKEIILKSGIIAEKKKTLFFNDECSDKIQIFPRNEKKLYATHLFQLCIYVVLYDPCSEESIAYANSFCQLYRNQMAKSKDSNKIMVVGNKNHLNCQCNITQEVQGLTHYLISTATESGTEDLCKELFTLTEFARKPKNSFNLPLPFLEEKKNPFLCFPKSAPPLKQKKDLLSIFNSSKKDYEIMKQQQIQIAQLRDELTNKDNIISNLKDQLRQSQKQNVSLSISSQQLQMQVDLNHLKMISLNKQLSQANQKLSIYQDESKKQLMATISQLFLKEIRSSYQQKQAQLQHQINKLEEKCRVLQSICEEFPKITYLDIGQKKAQVKGQFGSKQRQSFTQEGSSESQSQKTGQIEVALKLGEDWEVLQ